MLGYLGCSDMSAHKIQTPGNHPKERIQQSEHGESLKSKTISDACDNILFTECLLICQIIYVKFNFSILDAPFTSERCTVFLKVIFRNNTQSKVHELEYSWSKTDFIWQFSFGQYWSSVTMLVNYISQSVAAVRNIRFTVYFQLIL